MNHHISVQTATKFDCISCCPRS